MKRFCLCGSSSGHEGYVDEYGLRVGMVKLLEDIAETPIEKRPRLNINTFPNLIVCKSASLVKLDGMPYPGMLDSSGGWVFLASRGSQPFNVLLELLWTRLSYLFGLSPEIFGDDLEMEAVNILLSATAIPIGDKGGWRYQVSNVSREELSQGGA